MDRMAGLHLKVVPLVEEVGQGKNENWENFCKTGNRTCPIR